ncbi:hypothetical protein C8Q69DRAFT_474275 [Paecilomyces variotii]|uniref:Uncharacterized protein n=1 Tax=Byssochlamys spectabilis TaxID=264951 RepID=A0A443HP90_BYSSP|nr:hypothetical protein C8Q69DRAFT_474275 [Paecilomyces variotii]RWQ93635.1 hypothetical protein C8Q69DRAFT_474275 [Paecilomyces variotii]
MGRIHSAFFPVSSLRCSSEQRGQSCLSSLFPLPRLSLAQSLQVMDRFIEKNDMDEDEWNLVFVDSIDDYYDEASEAPVEDGSSPDSPFIGKTPQECHQLLLKLVEDTESEIITEYFAIMDERSTKDDTVLLVCAERNDEEEVVAWPTVRATFEVTAVALKCYLSGHSSIEEDLERAQREHDNVYRAR